MQAGRRCDQPDLAQSAYTSFFDQRAPPTMHPLGLGRLVVAKSVHVLLHRRFFGATRAAYVRSGRNPKQEHIEIGEFGAGPPDFGERWPRGEALGQQKSKLSGAGERTNFLKVFGDVNEGIGDGVVEVKNLVNDFKASLVERLDQWKQKAQKKTKRTFRQLMKMFKSSKKNFRKTAKSLVKEHKGDLKRAKKAVYREVKKGSKSRKHLERSEGCWSSVVS